MQKHAALYCRLSVDDGSFGGSVSIDTQKILLEQYCQSHEITSYEFYCDDGYSGTNFNRPAFQRMLTDIHADKINTVIVKDLSRFGRNYVEVGLQVEHFKEQNVRFIAADDHYLNGVTYRVWSVFEGQTSAAKSLSDLMLRRLETGDEVGTVTDEFEEMIQRKNASAR